MGAQRATYGPATPARPLTPSRPQVQLFLRKKLNMKASDSLVRGLPRLAAHTPCPGRDPHTGCWPPLLQFCYCRSAFAPAPDQTLADLYKVGLLCRPVAATPHDSAAPAQHFGTGKELIIQYSPKEAWG